jgi:hypothetical protein
MAITRRSQPLVAKTAPWIGAMAALLATSFLSCAHYAGAYHRKRLPSEISRIKPVQTRKLVQAGKALLVCAYADDLSFQAIGLDGAMSLQTFAKRHPSFPRNRLVIFY